MFVGDEVVLDVSFAVARARLLNLSQWDLLQSAAENAYGAGFSGELRVGALGLSRVVRVQVRELAPRDDSAGIAVRWEATGPGSALFPVLDADVRVLPAEEQTTLLTLVGAYRPPLGSLGEALDRAVLHRIAAATIRKFLDRVAVAITGQPGPAEATADPSPLPWAPEMS
jgi:hypothetical protein